MILSNFASASNPAVDGDVKIGSVEGVLFGFGDFTTTSVAPSDNVRLSPGDSGRVLLDVGVEAVPPGDAFDNEGLVSVTPHTFHEASYEPWLGCPEGKTVGIGDAGVAVPDPRAEGFDKVPLFHQTSFQKPKTANF